MKAIFDTLRCVFYLLFGAWCISDAIRDFRRQRYFLFGINIMLAIADISLLAYLLFCC